MAGNATGLSPPPDDRTTRRRALVAGVGVMAGILLGILATVAAMILGSDADPLGRSLEDTIHAWGAWGAALSIALMVMHSFVPFPAEFLAIANGMLYGPLLGTAITWSGAMLGAVLAFALARWLGRPFVEVIVARCRWQTLDDWTASEGAYVLLASRLIPVIAFNLINYAAGLSRVSWWTFLWTTGLGILPLTILMVAMGYHIDTLGWGSWLALFAGATVLWLVVRRRLAAPPLRDAPPIGYENSHDKRPRGAAKGRDSMAENEMLEAHQRTWHGFVKLMGFSLAGVVTVLVLMAIFLL